jgi:hypothetical protein
MRQKGQNSSFNHSPLTIHYAPRYFAAIAAEVAGKPVTSPKEARPPLFATLNKLIECPPVLMTYKYWESLLIAMSVGPAPVDPVTPLASIKAREPELLILYPDTLALPAFAE